MREFLRDPAIRFGLKLGIAGLLATYLALFLRLDEPTWALFTVFVLMVTPYVGTIMEKSVLRIFGTIIGAILGYLLLGWQQQPFLFLPVVAGILAFCVAMFGQGLWAYGFFLCGLTMIDVMQAGLGDPEMSWRYALSRAEEVVLGILVAVVVQSVLWPRYAWVEFEKSLKDVLTDIEGLLIPRLDSLFEGGEADTAERIRKLPLRVGKMRSLIGFGANESHRFHQWVPVFEEITDQLNLMALGMAALSKPLPPSQRPHAELQSRMQDLGRTLVTGLRALATNTPADETLLQVQTAQSQLVECLETARKQGDLDAEKREYIFSLGHHFQALIELAQAFAVIHEKLALIASGQIGSLPSPTLRGPSLPSIFWIRLGIKGGLAVTAALFLENWLHPPGGDLLAISAWILLVRGPTAPAGRGDWRAFHGALISIAAWLVLGIILLWVHPFLASYAVMNIVLFSLLFLWGYIFYGRNPMTTPMLVGMLMIVGIFGLNAQKPVSFQDIADLSLGMMLAILLSALIRRLIWPSLPQREILSRLRELSRLSLRVLGDGSSQLSPAERGRLALIPGEVSARLGLLGRPVLVDGQADQMREYLRCLHRGAMILSAAAGQSADWPDGMKQEPAYVKAVSLENDFREQMLANEKLIDGRTAPADSVAQFETAFNAKKSAIADLCRENAPRLPPAQWLNLLAFCRRMEEAGETILRATRLCSELDWSALKKDSSL
ncbi:hypothetical protein TSACC_2569 [Terrimicrobium sacchariphilum]|uniref:Fusaric acid resistance protein family protein n=1 Tax=Terrimicrobium sacchariphilum TaxID=690879 RepID=A0A146G3Z8_TERSA|nr:FUSC family protein [Terrimicrobium sacchariphilum]GAT32172.1 hypothetical protein TSACC_2569 [Terrimicrobium sacchariphilum]